uniref:SPATA31 domain-containing protein n=1 Tax=Loxodonta africana TaxID=9785 RepID=G3TPB4_LOXAF
MPHTQVAFTKNDNLNACVETVGTISHKTWGPCMLSQPTRAFWLFKWSTRDQEQSCHCQKTPNPLALALPSPALKVLNGLYPQPERQAEDSGDRLKQKHSELFCGFSCLTSESLVVTYVEFQGISTNRGIPPFPLNVSFFFSEHFFLPLLPNNPPQSASHSSTSTPNSVSPTDHQRSQINIPFWALAKFKALVWNLLQRQLQVRWELPAAFQRSQYVQTLMQYKPCDTAQSPETMGSSWSGKPISILLGGPPFFLDHAQRLLDFYLQKQLFHHHWGVSQKIKWSTGLLLSPADQQPLSSSSKALDNVNVPWSAPLEVSGVSDLISVTLAPVSDSMPHLLTKTKAILQSHIDSECCQILQGTVVAHIFISRDCRIPGSMVVAQFHCIPENKLLELQAATAPELYQKVMPSQTSPGAVIEHTKLSRSLPEGAMEKLGTNFWDKHLAFLSGLPALYHLAPSKGHGPAITSQSAVAEIMPDKPVEITPEPLTETISYEEQHISPRPGLQDDETRADGAQEFLTEVQEDETKEMVHLESQTDAAIPKALKSSILTKLNFHLRKKVLDI